MKYRLHRLLLLQVIASIATAVACSEPVDELNPGAGGRTTTSGTEPPEDRDAATTDGSTSSSDAASTPDASAPDTSGPKPTHAFGGAPSYAAKSGPSTRQAGHSFNNNVPKTNPAGRPCLNCHGASGGAPRFAAAGTVYAGTTPAPSVEVRAIGADGKATSAYTDLDGNFFFPAATQPIVFPALVGVRNATGLRVMSTNALQGSCNECHSVAGGAGQMVVTP